MAPRRINTKIVPSDRSRIYWEKAKDFFKVMRDAGGAFNWNGVGLAGVHCAISASDALLVAKASRRSSSKAHEDVADLIAFYVKDSQLQEQVKRLREILEEKNLIEYVDKTYTMDRALGLQKQVERYFRWVESIGGFSWRGD